MNAIKKAFVSSIVAGALLAGIFVVPVAYAQGILPGAGQAECEVVIYHEGKEPERFLPPDLEKAFGSKAGLIEYVKGSRTALQNVLGCALRTGHIHLFMLPFLVTFLIQFLLDMAGLVAVLFIVYGGFKYVVGGVSEDKEAGKKAITHAIVGLVVALSAWIVVNLIQIALTTPPS